MKIKKILYRNRRDFKAIFVCEHCGYEEELWGYDDSYYHNYVLPQMKCGRCGKTASENYKPRTPRYPDTTII